ncbi:hypothetical protein [Brachybacterium massiliense]|uniref:hypothetical protein n=1 Tax=Brachybacterium massiliense TaxID=1755098 RepID=UPI000B3BCDA5|nr:hypothetical protein [Brachybacterium massiliense]
MTARSTRRRQLTAMLAGALVPLVLLTGMLLPTSFEETEAGWTDTTPIAGEVTASTIPAPMLTRDCEFRPGGLGLAARVRIHWNLPEGYTLQQATLQQATGGVGSILEPVLGFSFSSNTAQNGDGTYTTTIPTGLLGGLLGLGSTMRFGITVEDPSGWRSEPAIIEAQSILLGIGTCEHVTV